MPKTTFESTAQQYYGHLASWPKLRESARKLDGFYDHQNFPLPRTSAIEAVYVLERIRQNIRLIRNPNITMDDLYIALAQSVLEHPQYLASEHIDNVNMKVAEATQE